MILKEGRSVGPWSSGHRPVKIPLFPPQSGMIFPPQQWSSLTPFHAPLDHREHQDGFQLPVHVQSMWCCPVLPQDPPLAPHLHCDYLKGSHWPQDFCLKLSSMYILQSWIVYIVFGWSVGNSVVLLSFPKIQSVGCSSGPLLTDQRTCGTRVLHGDPSSPQGSLPSWQNLSSSRKNNCFLALFPDFHSPHFMSQSLGSESFRLWLVH